MLDRDERVAVHVDGAAGVREEARFIGDGSQGVFASVRIPQGPVIGGVVICPALYEDSMRIYRREVLLARSLAARGMAVLRFDYRGTGNSDGDAADASFDSMREDARAAVEWLSVRCDIDRIGLLGTRWGGLVAAGVGEDDSPLVLWEPVIEGRLFFREAFRAGQIHATKEQRATDAGPSALETLRHDGSVDILGYPVYRDFYEDAIRRRLEAELGDATRPVLIVQTSRGERPRGEYQMLAQGLREKGLAVEVVAIDGDETWWFTVARWEAEEVRPGTERLLATTTEWLVRLAKGSR